MHQVLIQLPRKWKNKVERNVPASWNELSRGQLIGISALLHRGLDLPTTRIHLLRILLSLPWYALRRFTAEQLVSIRWLSDFIFKDNSLTKSLLSTIRPRYFRILPGTRLYGPGDNLRGVIYDEFAYCEGYFLQYADHRSLPALDKLIATLYRPKRHNYNPKAPDFRGDIREDFNEHLIERRAQLVARIPREQKLAILFYYQGCRNQLVKSFDVLFSKEEGNKAIAHPWLQMIRAIPNDKFGPIDQIERQKVHKVLFHLNEMIKEAKEAEKNAPKL